MALDQVNYKLLLNEMPEAFILLQVVNDEDGNLPDYIILELNHAFETISGMSKNEIIGKKVSALLAKSPNKDFEWLQIYNTPPNSDKRPQQFEYHNENKMHWYEVRVWSFQTNYLAVLFRDITTSKKEENLLHRNELCFHSLVETMKGGLVVEDENRNIILTNQAFCDIFSIPAPPEALVGNNCTAAAEEIKHLLAEPEAFLRRINEIIENQEVVIGEEIYFADGRVLERDYISVFTQAKTFIGHLWQYRDITAKKEADEKLKANEAQYRSLVENLNGLVYSIDNQGRLTYVSPNIKELTGYSAEEVIGKQYLEFAHPDDRAVSLEQFQNFLAGINEPREYRFLTKDGRSIWVRTSAHLFYKDGQLAAVQGVLTDITDRIKMEQELQKKEALQQLLMTMAIELVNIPLAEVDQAIDKMLAKIGEFSALDRVYVFRHNYENRVTINTHEWCAEGITAEIDNLQATPLELLPDFLETHSRGKTVYIPNVSAMPDTHPMRAIFEEQNIRSLLMIPLIAKGLNTGFVGFDAVRKEKEFTAVEISLLRVFAEMIVNIEERRQSEEDLSATRALNESIVQNVNEGIIISNSEGIVTFANPTLLKMAGYTMEEFIGSHWTLIVSPHYQDLVKAADARRQKGEVDRYELNLKSKAGLFIPLQVSGSPYYDYKTGEIAGTVAVMTDITELKKAEAEIAEKNNILELLNTFTLEQTQTNSYDSIIELILKQLISFTGARGGIYSEYNAENKTLNVKKIKAAEQALINKGVAIAGRQLLEAPLPVSNHLLCFMREKIVATFPSLSEATGGAVPETIAHAINQAFDFGFYIALAYVVEDALYGTTALCFTSNTPKPSEQFLRSFANIAAISLKRIYYEENIRYMSLHDQLTGLYNRHYFENELKRLDSSRDYPIAIISADIDGLKLINDTLGHSEGDSYLQTGAKLLKSTLRKSDILARVGGDEFALLLPHTARKAGEELLSRTRQAIEKYNLDQKDLSLSISFGLAVCENSKHTLEDAFRDADRNMYQDKLKRSNKARNAIIGSLINRLNKSDTRAGAVNKQVCTLSVRLGRKAGLDDRQIEDIRALAQFRDLGNVMLPANLHNKTGKLTEPEKDLIYQHSETGYRIATSSSELAGIADLILKHHENYDGTGYPLGLKSEEIPIECRVVAVCAAYCSMVNPRPYAQTYPMNEAVNELRLCFGKQHDPRLLELFIAMLADGPAATR